MGSIYTAAQQTVSLSTTFLIIDRLLAILFATSREKRLMVQRLSILFISTLFVSTFLIMYVRVTDPKFKDGGFLMDNLLKIWILYRVEQKIVFLMKS